MWYEFKFRQKALVIFDFAPFVLTVETFIDPECWDKEQQSNNDSENASFETLKNLFII